MYFKLVTCWSGCEVEQIQSSVEKLVEQAHETQHCSIRVVNVHYWILIQFDEFMRGFAL